MIRILTKNGVDNTNVDGARDHNFNAGRRSGIVQGALNQGNFFASNNNTIALDTCELRLCGHRIVLDKAEYRTFTNKPSVPVRYSFVARVVVDSDDNVSFEFVSQEATTQLVQDNLDITGSGTYELEIGKFTQLTDGNITDVVRTADLITGGADNDSDYIRIGTVTTNKISPELDADVDIENTINPTDNKPQTNFTFNLPTAVGTVVSVNGEEKTAINTDLTPTANSENLITSGGVHDYPAIVFAESERQKSKNLFDLNYNGTFGSKTEISVSKYISMKSVYGEKFTINTNLPQYSFTRGNIGDIFTNIIFNNLKPSTTYTISFVPISVTTESTSVHFLGVYNVQDNLGTKVTSTITTDENGRFNTDYGIWISAQNTTFTVSNVQLEEGSVATDYQPYYGQISHTGNKEIEFARNEYEKSKNLLNATTSETTFGNMTFSADTSNMYFNGSYTDADRCMFNSWALKKGTYTLNIEYISGSITRFENILFYIYKGGSWTQYSEAINLSSSNKAGSVSFTLDEDVNDARLTLYQNLTNTMTNCVFKYQIVEGSVPDFDFQPYNGSIVHKSEVEPVLIYDINTKNTIGGTAYTAGLNGNVTQVISSDIKRLRFYCQCRWGGPTDTSGTSNVFELDLDNRRLDYAQAMYVCPWRSGNNYLTTELVAVGLEQSTSGDLGIHFTKNGVEMTGVDYYCYKIEGIK